MIPLNRLRLDLDRKWSACQWRKWCDSLEASLVLMGASAWRVVVNETRRGFHVEIFLKRGFESAEAVVAAQAVLGSDKDREAMNLNRARQGAAGDWNALHDYKNGEKNEKPNVAYGRILAKRLRCQLEYTPLVMP